METTTQTAETVVAPAAPTESKQAQKDAVYKFMKEATTTLVLPEGLTLRLRLTEKDEVAKGIRKAVRVKLFDAIRSGQVKLSKQYDDSRLKKYCSGLINNWLKKDPRFN